MIEKIICHIFFYIYYQYNENLKDEDNKQIILGYIFIMTWSQSMSSFLVFNISSFYRKSILSNLIFLLFYLLIFSYIIYLLTLNDIAMGRIKFINIKFEFFNKNVDCFDDNHKLILLFIIAVDIAIPSIIVIILKILFEKKAMNLKKKAIK